MIGTKVKRLAVFCFGVLLTIGKVGLADAQLPDSGWCGSSLAPVDPCDLFPYIHSRPVPSIDTVNAVVIYACSSNASSDLLPTWWASIWNPDSLQSVPRYYKNNSLGKIVMLPTPYGQGAGQRGLDFA